MKRPLLKGRTLMVAWMSIACLMLAMGLSGCGDTNNGSQGGSTSTPSTTTEDNSQGEATPKDSTPSEPAASTPAEPAPTTTGNDVELVEIELELPQPLFLGTPKEPPANTTALGNLPPREPLRAPQGAKNLALNKPVTSSDDNPIIGTLDQITDGDKEATDGSYVELGSGKQWVVIDLKEPANIYGIVIWHFHADPRIYRDVVVQLADDQDFLQNVRTVFNNDQDNSLGLGVGADREYFESNEGHLIYVKGEKARYVRLWSQGNTADDQNHYIEVEVWGVPAK